MNKEFHPAFAGELATDCFCGFLRGIMAEFSPTLFLHDPVAVLARHNVNQHESAPSVTPNFEQRRMLDRVVER